MTDTMEQINQIIASDLPAIDKLLRAFAQATDLYLADGQRESDLLRALEDHEGLVKLQIKLSTIKSRVHRARLFLRSRLADYMERVPERP